MTVSRGPATIPWASREEGHLVRSRHRRPRHRVIAPWPDGQPDREAVAGAARSVGSPEHKSYPSPVGPPALRSDAGRCDPGLGYDEARFTRVLRLAIRGGCVGAIFE